MIGSPCIISATAPYKQLKKNSLICLQVPKSQRIKSVRKMAKVQKKTHMNSIETKLLGIVSKSKKEGKLDKGDTLLFNTYYNTLVGSREIDVNKLFGKNLLMRRTASTSAARSRLRDKKVRWADENKHKAKRNSLTESAGLEKLSKLVYGDQSMPIPTFSKLTTPQKDIRIDLSIKKLPQRVIKIQKVIPPLFKTEAENKLKPSTNKSQNFQPNITRIELNTDSLKLGHKPKIVHKRPTTQVKDKLRKNSDNNLISIVKKFYPDMKENEAGGMIRRLNQMEINKRSRKESIEPREIRTSESPRLSYLSHRSSSQGHLSAKKIGIKLNYKIVGEPNLKGNFMTSYKPYRHPLIKVQKPSKEEIERSKLRQIENTPSQYEDRAVLYRSGKVSIFLKYSRILITVMIFMSLFPRRSCSCRELTTYLCNNRRSAGTLMQKSMVSTTRGRKVLHIEDIDLI
ncbi:unnamed protein product [Moneuplotes crassus]|uniref:Uncharacterized protein n=1 Tax=Euplotes crassus TaxID=5936 RepID=A0AAD1XE39_EUPCR|nr:unnamed protein product [Moneuplotes crassus]